MIRTQTEDLTDALCHCRARRLLPSDMHRLVIPRQGFGISRHASGPTNNLRGHTGPGRRGVTPPFFERAGKGLAYLQQKPEKAPVRKRRAYRSARSRGGCGIQHPKAQLEDRYFVIELLDR